jgi:uncharacterized protein
MTNRSTTHATAFSGAQTLARGSLDHVVAQVHAALQRVPELQVLVFDDATGQPLDFDLRGSVADALGRLASRPPATGASSLDARTGSAPAGTGDTQAQDVPVRGVGRPRLGVVAREVTLLPRHWEWLSAQPGGASVALRKLVEVARRDSGGADAARASQQACYRFMSAMAGNLPGFEEAARALFASDTERFRGLTQAWPPDVRDHAWRLAAASFAKQG